MASADSTQAREARLAMYADWLAHDVDGLAYNIANPVGYPAATAILAEARSLVALALSRLDRAIEQDRANHAQEHA